MQGAVSGDLIVCGNGGDFTSIQAAIDAAASGDTIGICAGTYFESLTIEKNITLDGSDQATTIIDDQNGANETAISPNATVIIENVTFTNGSAGILNQGTLTLAAATLSSGNIRNQGTLTLVDTTMTQNGANEGGAIFNTENGYVDIIRSTLYQNNGMIGGAIANRGTMEITNSTISQNRTFSIGTGIWNSGNLTITHSTIADNESSDGSGAGIYNAGGTISLRSSIVARNRGDDNNDTIDCNGTITSLGNNIDSDGSCNLTEPSDMPSTEPLLTSLGDYGGPTQTYALRSGSPAIDAGNDAACPAADQRGVTRPQGAACDIGAFELGANEDVVGSITLIKEADPADGTSFDFTLDPPPVEYLLGWGRSGFTPRHFGYPAGIAVDSDGYVYVTDDDIARVQKFDAAGNFLLEWGSSGTGDGQFSFINHKDVAVGDNENIYVLDSGNQRIQIFDANGKFLAKWGSEGTGDGQFSRFGTTSLDIDASGNVYVVDWDNYRVQKFDASGNFLLKWGSEGSGNGQFNYPNGLAVDADGNVYVADTRNHRVQKFDANGNFMLAWGSEGNSDGQFSSPSELTVDIGGDVYVVDASNRRVQMFDTNGNYLAQWNADALAFIAKDAPRWRPLDLALDNGGNIYVTDVGNGRIHKFAPLDMASAGATLTSGQRYTFPDLPAGRYDLTEVVPSDWLLQGAACDNGDGATVIEDGLAVVLEFTEITCTFTNVGESTTPTTLSVCAGGADYATIQPAINAIAPGGTINICAGTYLENLTVDKDLTLQGEGATTTIIDGQRLATVVTIKPNATVTVQDITITNGKSSNGSNENLGGGIFSEGVLTVQNCSITRNDAIEGGGIYNQGMLTVVDSTIVDNDGYGGAIFSTNNGNVIIAGSTLNGNSGPFGGAIYNDIGSVMEIRTSTIRQNSSRSGGGIYNKGQLTVNRSSINDNDSDESPGGGIYNTAMLTVTNSTMSDNHVFDSEGTAIFNTFTGSVFLANSTVANNIDSFAGTHIGSGIRNLGGPFFLRNSIVANNLLLEDEMNDSNCLGNFTSLGHNIDGDGTCDLTEASDQPATDPRLAPLDDYGGSTRTIALLPNSPAIDTGSNDECPPTDQRGVSRPQGDGCDIGAYEADGSEPPGNNPPIITPTGNVSSPEGGSLTFEIRATDPDGDVLTFRASGLPDNLVMDSNTGVISGVVATGAAGRYNVTVYVSDGITEVSASFVWDITVPTSCGGPLTQEAEDGSPSAGAFRVGDDPNASGGQFIHVPNSATQVAASGINAVQVLSSNNYYQYCFEVTQAGTYRIQGWIYAENGQDNSFFVTVDGQPSDGYLWDIPINTSYMPDDVNNRGGADPVEIDLAVGDHIVRVYLREDGARLDKIALVNMDGNQAPSISSPGDQRNSVGDSVNLVISASDPDGDPLDYAASSLPPGLSIDTTTGTISGILRADSAGTYNVTVTVSDGTSNDSVSFNWSVESDPPTGCGTLNQEGENGTLFGKMVAGDDPNASGGQYVSVPDPVGSASAASASTASSEVNASSVLALNRKHRADFCVTITEAGDYRIRTQVMAPDHQANSFFVQVDEEPGDGYLYDIFPVDGTYVTNYVNDRDGAVPVIFSLGEGDHTISFILREDGARLDSFALEPVSVNATSVAKPSAEELRQNLNAEAIQNEGDINLFFPIIRQ